MDKVKFIYMKNDVPVPDCIISLHTLLRGNEHHTRQVKNDILSAVGDYIIAMRRGV